MFRKLLKNRKAQQTAEYALLISLVVAAVIAMQTYAQRTLQGRIRDAGGYLTRQTSTLGSTNQYEPYYLQRDYDVVRDDTTTEKLGANMIRLESASNRIRQKAGFEEFKYNTAYGVLNKI